MGNYLSTCNGLKSVSIINSTKSELPISNKTTIRLILVGLDNSGKTSTALHLLKRPTEDVIPTMGFDSYLLDAPTLNKSKETKVELIDLGGSIKIRRLWEEYFPSAHGLICLLDSADSKRFQELKSELEKILTNRNVQGKPLLLLLNKQDLDEAMDEVEIVNELNIEQMVNENKCPTKIEQCAVQNKNKEAAAGANQKKKKINLDNGIEQGFNWIVNYILNNWEKLDERVRTETAKEESKNREKMNALREKYKGKTDENGNDTDPPDPKVDPFKPIEEVVKEVEKKEKLKNGLKEEPKNKPKPKEPPPKEDSRKGKSKASERLAEKMNEVKKKAMVIKQSKVDDKAKQTPNRAASIEKQDSKEKDSKDSKEKDNPKEPERRDSKVAIDSSNADSKESKDAKPNESEASQATSSQATSSQVASSSQATTSQATTSQEDATQSSTNAPTSTATSSMDTISNETVIEVNK